MSTKTVVPNKMGTMPVQKLLINIALPIIISMTIQGLYNVIDSIFVAKINENALNAVSLAFPIQNIMISVAVGLSVGMNAVLSRSLGEKDQKKATDTAMNGLFLTCLTSLCFLVFAFVGVKPFFRSQTDIPALLHYGEEYLFLCSLFSFSLFFSITLERTLQATGQTFYTMLSQGIGAVVNIVLDPIFIFGYFGFPAMEVRGAAIATIIGQTVGLLLNIYFNWKHNPDLRFRFRGFRPNPKLCGEIGAIAVPSMAMGTVSSLLVYVLNQILLGISYTATAVLGVYYKLQSFIYMPVFGLTNGMIPILAYNYGAREYKRFMGTLGYSLFYTSAIMLLGTLSFQLFPQALISLFMEDGSSAEMLEIGSKAIGIISYAFPVAGLCIVGSATFQALGKGQYSLIATTLRQIVIQIPCAFFLSQQFGTIGVWYSFLIAECSAVILVGLLFRSLYQKEILPMHH